jgi:hypothetical protein
MAVFHDKVETNLKCVFILIKWVGSTRLRGNQRKKNKATNQFSALSPKFEWIFLPVVAIALKFCRIGVFK